MATADACLTARSLIDGAAQGPLLFADTGLSFWGGVDPQTGEIIDRHHPLSGRYLAGQVLAIPSGRGSCTGSSVMMELISNGHAPAGLILADPDEILTLGVMVAEYFFARSLPVVCVGHEAFALLQEQRWARIDGPTLSLSAEPPAAPDPHEPWHALPTAPTSLSLNDHDRALLAGEHGKAAQVAMQLVVRMAELQGATQLLDISQAHIDGCIYTGPASLRFARQLVQWGAQVRVPTTLNAISVDQRRWRELGIDPLLGEPASALGDAYMAMGAQQSFTCAPYLLDSAPGFGEQVVWAESNAVVYANSVLGARTLKYPDYLDICIALTGRAPQVGCHLSAQRQASLHIRTRRPAAADDSFYPLLGYAIGALCGQRIPWISGLEQAAPSLDDLKAFGAAFATTSAAPLFHLAGITPEALDPDTDCPGLAQLPLLEPDLQTLRGAWHELNSARDLHVQMISLGNPHFSASEFARLAALCDGRRKHPAVTLAITCGRAVMQQAATAGHVAVLERFGALLVTDTCWCMLGEPVIPPGARSLMTNSGKFAHYAPGLVGRSVHFASLAECVDSACTATVSGLCPAWLEPADAMGETAHV
jgi:predicted aconitase/predicted aconitase with swiveling domain